MHAAPEYFDSFETDNQGEVMVLKSDSTGLMKWSFLHSWAKEPNPLYNEPDWQSQLVYVDTSSVDTVPEDTSTAVHNDGPGQTGSLKNIEVFGITGHGTPGVYFRKRSEAGLEWVDLRGRPLLDD